MGVRVYECMGVCVCGCMDVWMYGLSTSSVGLGKNGGLNLAPAWLGLGLGLGVNPKP